MTAFALDRYLDRVALAGVPSPTADALIDITRAQAYAVPFENLSPYLGIPVATDIDGVAAKIIERRRGGYCFELNGLLRAALDAVGFRVMPKMARVFQDGGPPQCRTHYVIQVEADGRVWLADCGFGGASLRHEMPFELDRIDDQDGDRYRLRRDPHWGTVLQIQRDDWRDLYALDLAAFHPADVEMGNFYTNCWPNSRFRRILIAAKTTPGGRVTLQDRAFRQYRGGIAELTELTNPAQLRQVLIQDFALPADELDIPALARRLFAQS